MAGIDRTGVGRLGAALGGRTALLLAILILSASVTLLYAGTLASMIGVWQASSTFAHGFFILPASAFVIWRRRGALRPGSAKPSLAGFLVLALSVVLWLLSSSGNVQVGQHFAFIGMITAAVWAVLGTGNARAIRFPLLFAFFAVPFGEFLIPPLMAWTAEFAVWALHATGIPVYLEGYAFSLPSGDFEVIEACSGIRYLVVTVIVAIFFAHEKLTSLKRRLLFIAGAAAAIILANGIRAYLLVLIVHLYGREFGSSPGHIWLGWAVFVVSIFVIMSIGNRLADRSKAGRAVKPGYEGREAADERVPASALSWVCVAIAIVAMGPIGQRLAVASPSSSVSLTSLPYGAGSWSGPGATALPYRPMFSGDYHSVQGSYVAGPDVVDVHEIRFTEQEQGNELINDANTLFDHSKWRLVERARKQALPLNGHSIQVNRLVIADGHQRIVLWFWYDVGGWRTTSETVAKLYHALQAAVGRNTGDAVVILATAGARLDDGRDSARLEEFLLAHIDRLTLCLRASRENREDCRLEILTDTHVE